MINKIKEIFSESGYKGTSSRKGFDMPNTSNQRYNTVAKRDDHAEEMREYRADLKKKENEKAIKATGKSIYHPRELLTKSPLRFTLKESFINELIEYLNTNNKKNIKEALNLLNEYPKLKEYVIKESQKHFTNNVSIFKICEHFGENLNDIKNLSDNSTHIWSLTDHSAELKSDNYDDYMIIEAVISPDKVIIYIPAFLKDIEELIFSGKIDEPEKNIIRLAKQQNELLVEKSVNSGKIIKIN